MVIYIQYDIYTYTQVIIDTYDNINVNPDNTEFIRDAKMEKGRLKAYYSFHILGSSLQLPESVENLGFW